MIARIWHGWTSHANAAAYEGLLRDAVFPGIEARGIAGYRGIELLRQDHDDDVEFITIMRFDSLDAVRAFAGKDFEAAYVPPAAQQLLARFDARSQHYEIRETRDR